MGRKVQLALGLIGLMLFICGPPGVALGQGGASAEIPEVIGPAMVCYPTSYCSVTAGAKRYSSIIDCRNAQTLMIYSTIAGCGASTPVATQVEWLQENFNDVHAFLSSGIDGYALTSGWSYLDADTTITRVTSGDFLTTVSVRAPYARVAVCALHTITGCNFSTPSAKVMYARRYAPLQRFDDLAGVDDLIAMGDLFGTDLYLSDDLVVNGNGYIYDHLYTDAVYTTSVSTDIMSVDTSVTMNISVLGGTFLRGPINGTSWTLSYGYISPTTGTTQFTTGSVLLNVGTKIDRIGVRYTTAEPIGTDIGLTAIVTDGDGTMTVLDYVTSGAVSGVYRTLYTGIFDHTMAANESFVIVIRGADDDVHVQSVEIDCDSIAWNG